MPEKKKEDNSVPHPHCKPTILPIVLASFILGSFAGAAFGVLFALSLGEQHFARQVLLGMNAPAAQHTVLAGDRQIIEAVRKTSPSVVSIVVTKDVSSLTGEFPFDGFDLFLPPEEDLPTHRQRVGGGTGFIISSDGLILTNRHVVSDAQAQYEVIMQDGASYEAEVLALDPILDLAVLKIEAESLPVPEIGDSSGLEIGETVIAIGNALTEYRNTVTKGVVSGIGRRVVAGNGLGDAEILEEAIQTDAAINPGNSGGPLVDVRGRVIGINTAVNRAGQSIGFAIPIDAAKLVIESVKEEGRIIRPWLGVRYVLLDADTAGRGGLPVDHGALIVHGAGPGDPAVIPDSPADKAGLQAEDIILSIGGTRIDREHPLSSVIAKHRPGDTVMITILRGDEERTLQVTLGELPADL